MIGTYKHKMNAWYKGHEEADPTKANRLLLVVHRPQRQEKEMRLNLGLQKLIQGAKDVAAMKIVLAEEQKKLEVATTETMKMLSSLEVSSAEARKEGEQARKSFLKKRR